MEENREPSKPFAESAEPLTTEEERQLAALKEKVARRTGELENERAKLHEMRRARELRFTRRMLSLVTTTATFFALIGGVLSWFLLRFEHNNRLTDKLFQQADSNLTDVQLKALQEQIVVANRTNKELELTLAKYQAAVKSGQGASGLSLADRQTIARMESSYSDFDKRLSSLESALMQTPEKALSLPLLRQQLNDAQEKSKGDIEIVQGEINRVYGMMQWFLALVISTALAVTGLRFRQSVERKKTTQSST